MGLGAELDRPWERHKRQGTDPPESAGDELLIGLSPHSPPRAKAHLFPTRRHRAVLSPTGTFFYLGTSNSWAGGQGWEGVT